MNDFIVWYSNNINKDKFSIEFTLQELISQDHLDYISDSPLLVNYKIDSINDGIGLKDINGKSIYADSSIVEFDYLVDIENEFFQKRIGIFYFEKTFLAYHISFLTGTNRKGGNADNYNAFGMKNFKIIDTIQENKLGLIK